MVISDFKLSVYEQKPLISLLNCLVVFPALHPLEFFIIPFILNIKLINKCIDGRNFINLELGSRSIYLAPKVLSTQNI